MCEKFESTNVCGSLKIREFPRRFDGTQGSDSARVRRYESPKIRREKNAGIRENSRILKIARIREIGGERENSQVLIKDLKTREFENTRFIKNSKSSKKKLENFENREDPTNRENSKNTRIRSENFENYKDPKRNTNAGGGREGESRRARIRRERTRGLASARAGI